MSEPTPPADPDAGLVVPVDEIARRLGICDPSPADRDTIRDAIRDAQGLVEAHLGQPITPTVAVQTGRYPHPLLGWDLDHDPIAVLSVVAETYPGEATLSGLFTVTYTHGLDAANGPQLGPIRDYVRQTTLRAPTLVADWQTRQGDAAKRLSSVSTEGQSASWQYATPGGGFDTAAAGSRDPREVTLAHLDRWRVRGRRVFQRRTAPAPHPFTTGRFWL